MHGWVPGSFGMYGWLGFVLNLVIILAAVIGIIWLIIWLVRNASSNQNKSFDRSSLAESQLSARDILQLRYVRGEIDRDRYLEILDDIS